MNAAGKTVLTSGQPTRPSFAEYTVFLYKGVVVVQSAAVLVQPLRTAQLGDRRERLPVVTTPFVSRLLWLRPHPNFARYWELDNTPPATQCLQVELPGSEALAK